MQSPSHLGRALIEPTDSPARMLARILLWMPELPAQSVDPSLLEILRCPLTRSRLVQQGDWLVAEVGGLRYPIRDGIPVMLIEEAKLPEGVRSLDELKSRFRGDIPD